MNILPLNCFGNVQLVIANEKTTKRVKIYDSCYLSPPRASLQQILDFGENLTKIFNKGICLACTSSDREKLVKALRFA